MLCIKAIYDPESGNLTFEFSNNLLKEHFDLLVETLGKFKASGIIPVKAEIMKVEETRCFINFPVKEPLGESGGKVPKEIVDKISMFLSEFRNKAIEREFKTTEFIPLTGYPIKSLKEDVKEAIKNHRNFCIIDKYSEYLQFSRGETTKLMQTKVMYPSNEYSEVALYIHEENMKSLREEYKGKLEEIDWE